MAHTDYQIDGKSVISTTQIINHEKSDNEGIVRWANSLGFKNISYSDELNKAGNIGTEAHDYFDNYVADKSIPKEYFYQEAGNCFDKFKTWWDEYSKQNIEIVFTEESLLSSNYMYGGTADALIKLKDTNEHVLIDYKTGSNIYGSYLAQAGSYSNLVLENYDIVVDKFILARFGKKNDPKDFEIREYNKSDLKTSFEYFLILFEAYKIKKQIKNVLKRKGTKIKW